MAGTEGFWAAGGDGLLFVCRGWVVVCVHPTNFARIILQRFHAGQHSLVWGHICGPTAFVSSWSTAQLPIDL